MSGVLGRQVFLGGVPWDITESALAFAFRPFGPIRVEWPGKDSNGNPPKGYVYVLFESEKQVKAMLEACTYDVGNSGNCYFKISSRRMRSKEVRKDSLSFISKLVRYLGTLHKAAAPASPTFSKQDLLTFLGIKVKSTDTGMCTPAVTA